MQSEVDKLGSSARAIGGKEEPPILIAHGGGAVNTHGDVCAGVQRAIAAGMGMIELDVRRTGDGALVVHHGGPPGERSLAGHSYDEIAGPAIPLLEDVLRRVEGRAAINLELKEAGYEKEVLDVALRQLARERLLVSSFLDGALEAVRRVDPRIQTGLIIGRRRPKRRVWRVLADVFPFRRVRACGADVLVAQRHLDLTGMRARAAYRRIPLMIWTLNDPRALARALDDVRVAGVVTDRLDVGVT